MGSSAYFADPWWVNLLILVPIAAYYWWRKNGGLALGRYELLSAGVFGIAFGFVEAAVVVYLRASVGITGTEPLPSVQVLTELSLQLSTIEFWREIATMVMLASVAFLGAREWRERSALFLWAFALWDIFYYVGLRLWIGWPQSFTTPDVLFLVPVPWLSQVWFPLLVSAFALVAVIFGTVIEVAKKREGP